MWELTNSPTRLAAFEPASTAALTLPTSPRASTVISPPPIWIVFIRLTLAALTMASLASTLPTYPRVSIIPNASLIIWVLGSFDQFTGGFRLQIAGVAFVSVDVDFELKTFVHADEMFLQDHGARAAYFQGHVLAVFHAIKLRILRMHVDVPQRANHSVLHLKKARRAHQHGAGRAFDVAGQPQRNVKSQRDRV